MPDTSDLFEIMQTTRAMRRLKPDPVPDALIRKIIQAGVCAPNGGNTQRWRFLVLKDAQIKRKVQVWYKRAFDEVIGPRYLKSAPPPGVTREAYVRQHAAVEYLTDHFHEAPVWIVACIEEAAAPTRWSGASIYPAVQNMLLAARALGLGATLTTRHLLYEKESEAALGLRQADEVDHLAALARGQRQHIAILSRFELLDSARTDLNERHRDVNRVVAEVRDEKVGDERFPARAGSVAGDGNVNLVGDGEVAGKGPRGTEHHRHHHTELHELAHNLPFTTLSF